MNGNNHEETTNTVAPPIVESVPADDKALLDDDGDDDDNTRKKICYGLPKPISLWFLSSAVISFILLIAIIVVVAQDKRRERLRPPPPSLSPTQAPTGSPTVSPSHMPSIHPTFERYGILVDLFAPILVDEDDRSEEQVLAVFRNESSPQSQALQWMMMDSNSSDLFLDQPEEEEPQRPSQLHIERFVMAIWYFSSAPFGKWSEALFDDMPPDSICTIVDCNSEGHVIDIIFGT